MAQHLANCLDKLTISLFSRPEKVLNMGNYKTWTLDWTGLWTGLNYGLTRKMLKLFSIAVYSVVKLACGS